MTFKITLEAARVNAGFTQKEVAEKLNVNVGTVQNWESGKTKPSIEKFAALCNLYACPMDVIYFTL